MSQRLIFGLIAAVLMVLCLAATSEAIVIGCPNASKWCQILWCC